MQLRVTIRGGAKSNQPKIHPKKGVKERSEGDVNKTELIEKMAKQADS
jgi:hypothetical protein